MKASKPKVKAKTATKKKPEYISPNDKNFFDDQGTLPTKKVKAKK